MKRTYYIFFLLLLLSGCAKVVTPVGGPKDVEPPKMLKEFPENKQVNFASPSIKITFDEFFTLNNPNENVLVSPPFKHQPEYLVKGKTLEVKIKDTLQENTTYNMLFSNCIKDYNEGNPLKYYHYCFSTGSTLDSFMVQGTLQDAKTLQPEEDFFVMLYRGDDDLLPLMSPPDYVTKSLNDGSFTFHNITQGSYKIFALKDINSDLLYNLPNEAIAFDTNRVEAIVEPSDSLGRLKMDSLPKIQLFAFTAPDTVQQLLRYETPDAGIYKLPFKIRFEKFEASRLQDTNMFQDRTAISYDYFEEINKTRDTVTWYFKNILKDTLRYVLNADNHLDTLVLKPYKAKKQAGARVSKATLEASKYLSVRLKNEGDAFKPLTLCFSYPIRSVDSFTIDLYSHWQNRADTMHVTCSVPDTFVKELPVPLKLEAKKTYTLCIKDSVFVGYNGMTNDSVKTSFTTKSEKEYGDLTINYRLVHPAPYVAQLWSGTNLIQEDNLSADKTITYQHLEPGAYQILVYEDLNENQRWDVGNYNTKQQSEKVYQFQKPLNVRAYWEVEEEFVVEEQQSSVGERKVEGRGR